MLGKINAQLPTSAGLLHLLCNNSINEKPVYIGFYLTTLVFKDENKSAVKENDHLALPTAWTIKQTKPKGGGLPFLFGHTGNVLYQNSIKDVDQLQNASFMVAHDELDHSIIYTTCSGKHLS